MLADVTVLSPGLFHFSATYGSNLNYGVSSKIKLFTIPVQGQLLNTQFYLWSNSLPESTTLSYWDLA